MSFSEVKLPVIEVTESFETSSDPLVESHCMYYFGPGVWFHVRLNRIFILTSQLPKHELDKEDALQLIGKHLSSVIFSRILRESYHTDKS